MNVQEAQDEIDEEHERLQTHQALVADTTHHQLLSNILRAISINNRIQIAQWHRMCGHHLEERESND